MASTTLRRRDPNGRMMDIVLSAGVGSDVPEHIDLSQLDREQFPGWIAALKQAEQDTKRLRKHLEGVLAESGRVCPVCDTAVTGRADQIYCGARCRQQARRAASRG